MKLCNRCHHSKSEAEFHRSIKEKDGLQRACKPCICALQQQKRSRIKRGTLIPKKKLVHPEGMKICTKCMETRPADTVHFEHLSTGERGLMSECRLCRTSAAKARTHAMDWSRRLISYVNGPRHTSRTDEPFNLTPEFLEAMYKKQKGACAWTGVQMTTEVNSDRLRIVTLDRIDCSRGYSSDNVVLACKAVNQARGDASPAEFVQFLDDVRGYPHGNQVHESGYRREYDPSTERAGSR